MEVDTDEQLLHGLPTTDEASGTSGPASPVHEDAAAATKRASVVRPARTSVMQPRQRRKGKTAGKGKERIIVDVDGESEVKDKNEEEEEEEEEEEDDEEEEEAEEGESGVAGEGDDAELPAETEDKERAGETRGGKKRQKKQKAKKSGLHTLPLARVRRIVKSDPDVKLISNDAALLVCRSTELLCDLLIQEAFKHTQHEQRKTLHYRDVARVVALTDNLDFLLEVVPPRPEYDSIKVKKISTKTKQEPNINPSPESPSQTSTSSTSLQTTPFSPTREAGRRPRGRPRSLQSVQTRSNHPPVGEPASAPATGSATQAAVPMAGAEPPRPPEPVRLPLEFPPKPADGKLPPHFTEVDTPSPPTSRRGRQRGARSARSNGLLPPRGRPRTPSSSISESPSVSGASSSTAPQASSRPNILAVATPQSNATPLPLSMPLQSAKTQPAAPPPFVAASSQRLSLTLQTVPPTKQTSVPLGLPPLGMSAGTYVSRVPAPLPPLRLPNTYGPSSPSSFLSASSSSLTSFSSTTPNFSSASATTSASVGSTSIPTHITATAHQTHVGADKNDQLGLDKEG